MPVSGSNRGHEAWEYIRPLSLMQYGGGRHIADLRELTEEQMLRGLVRLETVFLIDFQNR